jgi:hypothetical protein
VTQRATLRHSDVEQGAEQASLGVQRQVAAVHQVVDAMAALHSGAQEAAAGATQTKSGIRTLREAAKDLAGMV